MLLWGEWVLPDVDMWWRWGGMSLENAKELWPDQLILPHPRLHERAFVLDPLVEIAPDLRHPVLDKTAKQLADDLPAKTREGFHVIGKGADLL